MTIDDFKAFLAASEPGEIREYHRGYLARDRAAEDDDKQPIWPGLDKLADAILAAADAGDVLLVQRRIAAEPNSEFSYIAIKRARSLRRLAA